MKLNTDVKVTFNQKAKFVKLTQSRRHGVVGSETLLSACSLVGFSHDLSASQQYFPLTTNQHQPDLSAQKPTSEQVDRRDRAKIIETGSKLEIMSIREPRHEGM